MNDRICSVEGCLKKHEARGYCAMHYQRLKSGLPMEAPPLWVKRDALCGFDGCDRAQIAKGYCTLHYQRHRDGRPMDAFVRGVDQPTTYKLAHKRIAIARGPARDHCCVDCGDRADDWSYNGGCPNERYEAVRGKSDIAFSPDPMAYSPRCTPCHVRFDLDQRRAAA